MSRKIFGMVLLIALPAVAAQLPLPELRIEPTTGGSIFYVRNVAPQPLTAFLIELVDYPGSSYLFWQDAPSEAIPPGAESRIPVANMTVGAVPDYVKMQAALYADGRSSGIAGKVTQLIERRRSLLETTRELIQRMEKEQSAGASKTAIIAGLKAWADSLPAAAKANRNSQAAINQAATRSLLADTIARLNAGTVTDTLASLHASELVLVVTNSPAAR